MQRGQMEIVFVAERRQSGVRLVRSGRRMGADIEILAVSAGEAVVVSGAEKLRDGQALEVE